MSIRHILNKVRWVFLCTILCGALAGEEVKKNVFVAWPENSYEPFYRWDKKEETFKGIDPEVIELILKDAGIDFEYVYPKIVSRYPRIEVLLTGKADISIRSFSITEERKKLIDFSTPYFRDGQALLVRKNSKAKSYEDLTSQKILSYPHTTGHDFLQKKGYWNDFYKTLPEAYRRDPIELILEGKVDAMINDRSNLVYTASVREGLKVLPDQLTKEFWGIGVRKGDDELRELLDRNIKKNLMNGKIKAIFEKYGVEHSGL